MKRVVKSIDVFSKINCVEIHFDLFGKPKRVFQMHPARWLKLLESAKAKSVDIHEIVDSLYHSVLLHFAENKSEVYQ